MTQTSPQWNPVCELADIAPNTGVCALVQDQQIAVFRPADEHRVFAIGNFDPAGQANVLSRGLLAHLDGQWTVASPLYKHHFNLEDGRCCENSDLQVPVYQVRINGNMVEVAL